MANSNSDNPLIGRKFQLLVRRVLERTYKEQFEIEPAIAIGASAKDHKFDLANEEKSIVAECKCYTWIDSGNVPSAKLMN